MNATPVRIYTTKDAIMTRAKIVVLAAVGGVCYDVAYFSGWITDHQLSAAHQILPQLVAAVCMSCWVARCDPQRSS